MFSAYMTEEIYAKKYRVEILGDLLDGTLTEHKIYLRIAKLESKSRYPLFIT